MTLRGPTSAFTLIEAALALGLTSFCLVALLGLIPVGLKSNRASIQQTAADTILSSVLADLAATPKTSPAGQATVSRQFGIPIPATPVASPPPPTTLYFVGDGRWSSALETTSLYRLTVTPVSNVSPSSGSAPRAPALFDLKVTWPASADPGKALGSAETFAAFGRN